MRSEVEIKMAIEIAKRLSLPILSKEKSVSAFEIILQYILDEGVK